MTEEKIILKDTKKYTEEEFRELVEEVCNHGAIHSLLYFDAQGEDKQKVQDALVAFMDALNKEKGILYCKAMIEEVVETEGIHSTFSECEIITKDLASLNHIVLKYTPVGVQIVHPTKEITMTLEQTHQLLLNSAEFSSAIANLILKSGLNDEQAHEIEERDKRRMEFARKLLEKAHKEEKSN